MIKGIRNNVKIKINIEKQGNQSKENKQTIWLQFITFVNIA